MKPPHVNPSHASSGPWEGSHEPLEALSDKELGDRARVLTDALQRIRDEQWRRRNRPDPLDPLPKIVGWGLNTLYPGK